MKTTRKLTQICLLIAILLLPAVAQAQYYYTNSDGIWSYTPTNGPVTITGFTLTGSNVMVIPDTINSYPVTTIGAYAFYDQTSLTGVIIPDSVTTIDYNVFNNCSGLTSVTIGNSVTSIGEEEFYDCSRLTNIVVNAGNASYASAGGVLFNQALTTLIAYPNGLAGSYAISNSVTSIGDYAFEDCSGLTNVTIDTNDTSIGDAAFGDCSGLTNVTIPQSVTSIGDYAFDDCHGLKSVTIPDSVISIGDGAFEDCSGLTNVAIGTNTASIGDAVFLDCSGLTNIVVNAGNTSYASAGGVLFNKAMTTLITYPNGLAGSYAISNSVTSIGDDAFGSCSGLTSVTIPDSVTSVGDDAFYDCSGLTNVTIGTNATSIGVFAFAYCSGLTNVTIPDSVTSIDYAVFYDCSGLTSVTIGTSVTSIGDESFAGCSGLTNVTIPNSVSSIGDDAFFYCYGLTSVTIPDSVTSIGDYVFEDCSGLTNVMIPSSVTNIGEGAFAYCSGLRQAFFQGNAPGVDGESGSVDSTVFQYAGAGTVYFLPGTTGWGSSFGGWPTAFWVLPNPLILNKGLKFGPQNNQFGLTISWASNATVVVEACVNLAHPVWSPLSTNTLTAAMGTSVFNDPHWTNYPSRFYRLSSP